VLSNASVEGLLSRHVLYDDEGIDQIESAEDRVTVSTRIRRFTVRSELGEWLVGRESWVSDFVVATRADLHVQGQPERFGFLLPTNAGPEVYVNDVDAMAHLGTALPDSIDTLAYAELLVQFHPYTSAIATLLTQTDDLRQLFGLDGLPDVRPFEIERAAEGVTLTFSSCVRYRMPASFPQLDVFDWRVTAGPGRPADWESAVVAEGLSLDA
jgi:hypothetical protein